MPSFPIFSLPEWGRYLPILKSTAFYRVWVVVGGLFIILWSLHNLHGIGWGAQPLYMACLFAFFFFSGEGKHEDAWYMQGPAHAVSAIFEKREFPALHHVGHQDFILFAITGGATLLGLFSGGLFPGAMGLLWIAGTSVAIAPSPTPALSGSPKSSEKRDASRSHRKAEKTASFGSPMAQPDSDSESAAPLQKGKCPNCKTQVPEGIRFCYECGQEVLIPEAQKQNLGKTAKAPSTPPPEDTPLEDGIPMIPITGEKIESPSDAENTEFELPKLENRGLPNKND